jgi:hypothetical protein
MHRPQPGIGRLAIRWLPGAPKGGARNEPVFGPPVDPMSNLGRRKRLTEVRRGASSGGPDVAW